MSEYPLAQAANRAGMDERSFRLLGERRTILATPRTRTLGRGKQKLYPVFEIFIASILASLLKLGANTYDLADIADYLRSNASRIEEYCDREGDLTYLVLRYQGEDNWGIELRELVSRNISSSTQAERMFLDATDPHPDNADPAQEFFAIKLRERFGKVTRNLFDWYKANCQPSDVAKYYADGGEVFLGELEEYHTRDQVGAFVLQAGDLAANSKSWEDSDQ